MLSFTLNDGNTIPWLGIGTGTALYHQDATNAVAAAIKDGIVHFDGAQMYQNEDSLGNGIKASGKPRSELFITTKLLEVAPGPLPDVKASLTKSLKKLGTDYVDLFLVHSPFNANKAGQLKDLWKQFEEVQKIGLAKSIGVSNFQVDDLKDILETATVVPAVNQIELHPYIWAAAKPIYEFSKEKGIVVASYSGLTPVARVPGGPVDPVLASISARLEKETGKKVGYGPILTKWLLQKDVVVITTTSKPERVLEYLTAPELPDLTSDEIAAIEREGSKLHKRCWMAHIFGEA